MPLRRLFRSIVFWPVAAIAFAPFVLVGILKWATEILADQLAAFLLWSAPDFLRTEPAWQKSAPPNCAYSKVRSEFIRAQIRETCWADRHRIDALIRIEMLICSKQSFRRSNMALRKQYALEFHLLEMELLKGEAVTHGALREAELQFQRKVLAHDASAENGIALTGEEALQDWLEAGGLP